MHSSQSKKPVWAVICGAIRNLYEFYPALAYYTKLKEEGVIQGIVLSTWHGEVDQHIGLREKLLSLGIGIAESKDAKTPGPNNLWRQFRSLDQGLRLCPRDCYILKGRTDKISGYIENFREPIMKLSEYESEYDRNDPFAVFEAPLIVPFYSLTYPFLVKDIAFLGTRNTFDMLCHFESWTDIAQSHSVWPEARWKSFPFMQRFPIFKEVSEQFNLQLISTALVRDSNRSEMPDVISRLFALYFKIMITNFRTCFMPEVEWDGSCVEKLMSQVFTEGVGLAPHEWEYTFVMKDDVLKKALNVRSPLSERINSYLSNPDKLLSWQYLSSTESSQLDTYLNNSSIKSLYVPKTLNRYTPASISIRDINGWSGFFEYSKLVGTELSDEELKIIERPFNLSLDFAVAIKDLIIHHIHNADKDALKRWISIGSTFPEMNSWRPSVDAIAKAICIVLGASSSHLENLLSNTPTLEVKSLDFAKIIIDACLNTPGCNFDEVINFLTENEPRTKELRSWLLIGVLEKILDKKISLKDERIVITELINNPPYLASLCTCASWLLQNKEVDLALLLLEKVEIETKDQILKEKVSKSRSVIINDIQSRQISS